MGHSSFKLLVCAAVVFAAGGTARAAGLFVSSFSTKQVHLLDSDTGAVIRTYANAQLNNPTGLALSSDGGTLYVGSSNSTVDAVAFNARTGAFIRTYSHTSLAFTSGLAVSNDGQTLYAAGFQQTVYRFNTGTGVASSAFSLANHAFDLELAGSGANIFAATGSGGNNVARIGLAGGGSATFSFPQFSAPFGLALSPNESVLYAALANDGATSTNMIAVLNAATGARTGTFTVPGPLGDMLGLDISTDGSTLFASDGFNDLIYRVNTATGAATPLVTPAVLDGAAYVLYTDDPTVVPEPAAVCALLPLGLFLAGRRARRD